MARDAVRSPRPVHRPAYRQMLARLREARRDAELTQAEVARQLGKTQTYVSKCELGERRIDPVELSELARVYSRPLDYFVAGVPAARRRRNAERSLARLGR
jgi:transcriptional regulator with XRE-family HTH domain